MGRSLNLSGDLVGVGVRVRVRVRVEVRVRAEVRVEVRLGLGWPGGVRVVGIEQRRHVRVAEAPLGRLGWEGEGVRVRVVGVRVVG